MTNKTKNQMNKADMKRARGGALNMFIKRTGMSLTYNPGGGGQVSAEKPNRRQ